MLEFLLFLIELFDGPDPPPNCNPVTGCVDTGSGGGYGGGSGGGW